VERNDQGWFFPQLSSFLICSFSFAIATWKDSRARGGGKYLASLAFALAVLRLLARLLSSYAGPRWYWLDGFNGPLYFPAVLVINTLLTIWFFLLAREAALENADF